AGKTTLVVALAAEFVRQRRRVATIKHGHHPALVDTEGTDTWRHFNEGMALRVMIESPGQRVLFERTESDGEPEALARQYMGGMDVVLVEGFKQSTLPKIEVHRKTQHRAPLYDPAAENRGLWVAMVTDDEALEVPLPILRFSDTSWLVALSALAWNQAKVLSP
ncbi:MAG: molybdopterin-guanine dinucleotide biosynthesis protein B, partial [Gemmatimonadetes bacterium]|nr:molybdopterin-guanine dinucleotide biosynthesis protein B [Gemmatimonadota bacterium]